MGELAQKMRRNKIIRFFFNRLYRWRLPEFVQYWKTGDLARAKLVTLKDGAYAMVIEGEKYPLMGFPRGPVLFGPLAKLKHLGKNLIFNEVWRLLEEGKTNEEVMSFVKNVAIPILLKEIEKMKYDMFPLEKLCPAVRELWRAMSEVEKTMANPQELCLLKKGLTFFFQEDDAYRFRFQWAGKYINPHSFWRKIYRFFTSKSYSFKKEIELILNFLESAEIVPDMKGRIQLIKRVMLAFLEDKEFGALIEQLMWKIDWRKVGLSKADTYYFRGKYFKVDHAVFDY